MLDASITGDFGQLDKLAEEFVERYRRGERASLQEYIDRCPELETEIRELFPALVEVELVEQAFDDCGAITPSLMPHSAPLDQLGDYRILREIGRGGMGVVYEAEQLSLGRRVALKVLPRTLKNDALSMMRFRREARSAARLHHTNIVPVFDVGQDGDVVYYAMQFIQGQGLDVVVEELKRLRDDSRGAIKRVGQAQEKGAPGVQAPVALTVSMTSATRAGSSRNMARSLLDGQFKPDASPLSVAMTSAGSPTFERPAVDLDATTHQGEPESVRAPTRGGSPSSGSTVLPGGTQISASESSGRRQPFFRSVAEIGRQVAAGLAHAHGRGIVHRDIKPSNLLLDAAGIVWITDFGLAKSGEDSLTASGDILGTLRYMAPERFRGEGDSRADVYALGVTLYELLTLRPTFDSPDRLRLIQQVKDQEPQRPRSLDPRIPRDLETIVLKTIEKDPRRRYATADELGEDLRRFLDGEPIKARQVGEVEKVWKWARRRPAIASLMLLAVGSMLVGTAVSSRFALRANERAEAASLAEIRSRGSEADAKLAREAAIVERDNSRRLSAGLAFDRGLALAEEGQADRGLHWMLEGLKTAPDDEGDFRLMVRRNLGSWLGQIHEPLKILTQDAPNRRSLAARFSPDGRTFVTGVYYSADIENPVFLRETATGRVLATYPEAAFPVAFRSDAKILVFCWKDLDCLRAVDLTTGSTIWTTPRFGMHILGFCFLPGGTELLAVFSKDGKSHRESQILSAVDGRPLGQRWKGQYGLSPDGRFLISERDGEDRSVFSLLDPGGGNRVEIFRTTGEKLFNAGLGPDARTFWATTFESWTFRKDQMNSRIWDLATRKPIGPVLEQTSSLGFFPAGDRILAQKGAGSISLRDPSSGRTLGPAFRGDGSITSYNASPDGRLVLTRSEYGTTHLWKLAADPAPATTGRGVGAEASDAEDTVRGRLARAADFHPRLAVNGRASFRWVLGLGGRAVVQVTDTTDGRAVGIPARHQHTVIRALCPDPEGRRFATGSDPGTLKGEVRLWDAATGRLLVPPMLHTNYVSALAFQPGGRLLAAGDYHGLVRLWDTTTGKEVGKPLLQGAIVWSLAFSPDGKTLAVGHHYEHAGKPGVLLWDVQTGRKIGDLLRHPTAVSGMVFRPDGRVLAATDGMSIQLWDATGGRAIGDQISGETAPAFRPDGKAFITASGDGSIRLRDASTGALGATIFSGPSPVRRVAYREDGQLIVAGFEDGSVRLIDPATSRQIGPARLLRCPVSEVAFKSDGRSFVAVDELGESRTWTVPEVLGVNDLDELTLRIEARSGYRMANGPAVLPLDAKEWAERIDRVSRLDGPPSLDDDPSWHEPMAREAEEKGNTFAALWHLDRLIAARPDDWTLLARRARGHSSAGAFDRAAADYEQAARLGPREAVLDWQAQCVTGSVEAGRHAEALWYLDRLVAARPDDWTLYDDRSALHAHLGRAAEAASDRARALELGGDSVLVLAAAEKLAMAGRWPEAARLLAACGRQNPLDPELAQAWTVACLAAGDRAGYLQARAAIVARASEVPKLLGIMLSFASNLTLGSGVAEDSGPIAKWFESRRSALPSSEPRYFHAFSNILGGLDLRAGGLDKAIARLSEGIAAGGGEIPSDWAFLALAHAQKGELASARLHLDRLKAWNSGTDQTKFWDIQEIELLRREAEALILDSSFPANPFAL
jgi:WD40 repeat protein/tetratricopeptide (TPR) repeat protein